MTYLTSYFNLMATSPSFHYISLKATSPINFSVILKKTIKCF